MTGRAPVSWARHCWTVARQQLLPHLPLEVIRLRVRRAAEIGLDYRTYALARETSGRDIIAFLYSSNALRLVRPGDVLPDERARRLREVGDCARTLLAHAPLDAEQVAASIEDEAGIAFAGAAPAPGFWASWRELRAGVLAALAGLPAGGVMLVLSFLAFFPMTCICIAVLVSFAGPDTAESKVETEMKEFFKTPGASQS